MRCFRLLLFHFLQFMIIIRHASFRTIDG